MLGAKDNRFTYAGIGLVWLAVTLHTVFVPAPPYAPQAGSEALARFATSTLQRVQQDSIEYNQEYCGVILESDDGELSVSRVYEGGRADCAFERLSGPGLHVVASFHTHGGVDPDYDSEFPSLEDVTGDMEERITGFIATPGGRIWRINWETGVSSQLCGERCITQDPDFATDIGETPQSSYSLSDLEGHAGATDEDL